MGYNRGSNAAPATVDLDNDGDMDVVVGNDNGKLAYFKNGGTATNPVYTEQTGTANPFNGVNVGSNAAPATVDLDNDGLVDVVVGGGYGKLVYFKNTGSSDNPVYTEQTGDDNPFDGVDVGYETKPVATSNNSLVDLVVGNYKGNLAYLKFYKKPVIDYTCTSPYDTKISCATAKSKADGFSLWITGNYGFDRCRQWLTKYTDGVYDFPSYTPSCHFNDILTEIPGLGTKEICGSGNCDDACDYTQFKDEHNLCQSCRSNAIACTNLTTDTICQQGWFLSVEANAVWGLTNRCTLCTPVANAFGSITCISNTTSFTERCKDGYFKKDMKLTVGFQSSCTACTPVDNAMPGTAITCTNADDSIIDACTNGFYRTGVAYVPGYFRDNGSRCTACEPVANAADGSVLTCTTGSDSKISACTPGYRKYNVYDKDSCVYHTGEMDSVVDEAILHSKFNAFLPRFYPVTNCNGSMPEVCTPFKDCNSTLPGFSEVKNLGANFKEQCAILCARENSVVEKLSLLQTCHVKSMIPVLNWTDSTGTLLTNQHYSLPYGTWEENGTIYTYLTGDEHTNKHTRDWKGYLYCRKNFYQGFMIDNKDNECQCVSDPSNDMLKLNYIYLFDKTPERRCHKCPLGFHQPLVGKDKCDACAPGTFGKIHANVNTCALCPVGFYQPMSGETECKECYYSIKPGEMTCSTYYKKDSSQLVAHWKNSDGNIELNNFEQNSYDISRFNSDYFSNPHLTHKTFEEIEQRAVIIAQNFFGSSNNPAFLLEHTGYPLEEYNRIFEKYNNQGHEMFGKFVNKDESPYNWCRNAIDLIQNKEIIAQDILWNGVNNDNLTLVKQALALKANKFDRRYGKTALDIARTRRKWDIIQLLSVVDPILDVAKFLDAVKQGNAEDVRKSLYHSSIFANANVYLTPGTDNLKWNYSKTDKSTLPLIVAILNDKIDIVELLISYGANINFETVNGITPFMVACHSKPLLAKQWFGIADFSKITPNGASALSMAIHGENWDIVDDILQETHGQFVNKKITHEVEKDKGSLYFGTAPCPEYDFSQFYKYDHIIYTDWLLNETLKMQIDENNTVQQQILSKPPCPFTPLSLAAYQNNVEIVSTLLKYDADTDPFEEHRLNPFYLSYDPYMLNPLTAEQVNNNESDSEKILNMLRGNITTVDELIKAVKFHHIATIQYQLELDCRVGAKKCYHATRYHKRELVRALHYDLITNADNATKYLVNQHTTNGDNALTVAMLSYCNTFKSNILDCDHSNQSTACKFNVTTCEVSGTDVAMAESMVRMLVEYGADTTIKDKYGRTPLHYAAYFRNTKAHGIDRVLMTQFFSAFEIRNATQLVGNMSTIWTVKDKENHTVPELWEILTNETFKPGNFLDDAFLTKFYDHLTLQYPVEFYIQYYTRYKYDFNSPRDLINHKGEKIFITPLMVFLRREEISLDTIKNFVNIFNINTAINIGTDSGAQTALDIAITLQLNTEIVEYFANVFTDSLVNTLELTVGLQNSYKKYKIDVLKILFKKVNENGDWYGLNHTLPHIGHRIANSHELCKEVINHLLNQYESKSIHLFYDVSTNSSSNDCSSNNCNHYVSDGPKINGNMTGNMTGTMLSLSMGILGEQYHFYVNIIEKMNIKQRGTKHFQDNIELYTETILKNNIDGYDNNPNKEAILYKLLTIVTTVTTTTNWISQMKSWNTKWHTNNMVKMLDLGMFKNSENAGNIVTLYLTNYKGMGDKTSNIDNDIQATIGQILDHPKFKQMKTPPSNVCFFKQSMLKHISGYVYYFLQENKPEAWNGEDILSLKRCDLITITMYNHKLLNWILSECGFLFKSGYFGEPTTNVNFLKINDVAVLAAADGDEAIAKQMSPSYNKQTGLNPLDFASDGKRVIGVIRQTSDLGTERTDKCPYNDKEEFKNELRLTTTGVASMFPESDQWPVNDTPLLSKNYDSWMGMCLVRNWKSVHLLIFHAGIELDENHKLRTKFPYYNIDYTEKYFELKAGESAWTTCQDMSATKCYNFALQNCEQYLQGITLRKSILDWPPQKNISAVWTERNIELEDNNVITSIGQYNYQYTAAFSEMKDYGEWEHKNDLNELKEFQNAFTSVKEHWTAYYQKYIAVVERKQKWQDHILSSFNKNTFPFYNSNTKSKTEFGNPPFKIQTPKHTFYNHIDVSSDTTSSIDDTPWSNQFWYKALFNSSFKIGSLNPKYFEATITGPTPNPTVSDLNYVFRSGVTPEIKDVWGKCQDYMSKCEITHDDDNRVRPNCPLMYRAPWKRTCDSADMSSIRGKENSINKFCGDNTDRLYGGFDSLYNGRGQGPKEDDIDGVEEWISKNPWCAKSRYNEDCKIYNGYSIDINNLHNYSAIEKIDGKWSVKIQDCSENGDQLRDADDLKGFDSFRRRRRISCRLSGKDVDTCDEQIKWEVGNKIKVGVRGLEFGNSSDYSDYKLLDVEVTYTNNKKCERWGNFARSNDDWEKLQRRGNYQVRGCQPKVVLDPLKGERNIDIIRYGDCDMPLWWAWGAHVGAADNDFTEWEKAGKLLYTTNATATITTTKNKWLVNWNTELDDRVNLDETAREFCHDKTKCDHLKNEYEQIGFPITGMVSLKREARLFRVEEELHIDGPVKLDTNNQYSRFLWGKREYLLDQPGGLPVTNDVNWKVHRDWAFKEISKMLAANPQHRKTELEPVTSALKDNTKCTKPATTTAGLAMKDQNNITNELPTCSTSPYKFAQYDGNVELSNDGNKWFTCLSIAEYLHYEQLLHDGHNVFHQTDDLQDQIDESFQKLIKVYRNLSTNERPDTLFWKSKDLYGIRGFEPIYVIMKKWREENPFAGVLDDTDFANYKNWANSGGRRLGTRRKLGSMDLFASLSYFSHNIHHLGLRYKTILSKIGLDTDYEALLIRGETLLNTFYENSNYTFLTQIMNDECFFNYDSYCTNKYIGTDIGFLKGTISNLVTWYTTMYTETCKDPYLILNATEISKYDEEDECFTILAEMHDFPSPSTFVSKFNMSYSSSTAFQQTFEDDVNKLTDFLKHKFGNISTTGDCIREPILWLSETTEPLNKVNTASLRRQNYTFNGLMWNSTDVENVLLRYDSLFDGTPDSVIRPQSTFRYLDGVYSPQFFAIDDNPQSKWIPLPDVDISTTSDNFWTRVNGRSVATKTCQTKATQWHPRAFESYLPDSLNGLNFNEVDFRDIVLDGIQFCLPTCRVSRELYDDNFKACEEAHFSTVDARKMCLNLATGKLDECPSYPEHNITGCLWSDIKNLARTDRIHRGIECSKQYVAFCDKVSDNEDTTEYKYLQECYDRGIGNRVMMIDQRDAIEGTHAFSDCTHGYFPDLSLSTFKNTVAGPTYALKFFPKEEQILSLGDKYTWGSLREINQRSPHILLGPGVNIYTSSSKQEFITKYGDARIKYEVEDDEYYVVDTVSNFVWDNTITLVGRIIFEGTLKEAVFRDVDFRLFNLTFQNVVLKDVDFNGATIDEDTFGDNVTVSSARGSFNVTSNSVVENLTTVTNSWGHRILIGETTTNIENINLNNVTLDATYASTLVGRSIGQPRLVPNTYKQMQGYIYSGAVIQHIYRQHNEDKIIKLPFSSHSSWKQYVQDIPFNRVRGLRCLDTWKAWHNNVQPIYWSGTGIQIDYLNASDGRWGCGLDSIVPWSWNESTQDIWQCANITDSIECVARDTPTWRCISGVCKDNVFEHIDTNKLVSDGVYVNSVVELGGNTIPSNVTFFNVKFKSAKNVIFNSNICSEFYPWSTDKCLPTTGGSVLLTKNAAFENAILDGLVAVNEDFSTVTFQNVTLKHANLQNSTFKCLQKCDLYNSTMKGASISCSSVNSLPVQTTLLNCPTIVNSEWSCLSNQWIGPKFRFTGSLDNVDISHLDLTGADLSGAQLGGMISGSLLGCPRQLPDGYKCVVNIKTKYGHNLKNIFGPNITVELKLAKRQCYGGDENEFELHPLDDNYYIGSGINVTLKYVNKVSIVLRSASDNPYYFKPVNGEINIANNSFNSHFSDRTMVKLDVVDRTWKVRRRSKRLCEAQKSIWYKGYCKDLRFQSEQECVQRGFWEDGLCTIGVKPTFNFYEPCDGSLIKGTITNDDIESISFEGINIISPLEFHGTVMPQNWKNANLSNVLLASVKIVTDTNIEHTVMPKLTTTKHGSDDDCYWSGDILYSCPPLGGIPGPCDYCNNNSEPKMWGSQQTDVSSHDRRLSNGVHSNVCTDYGAVWSDGIFSDLKFHKTFDDSCIKNVELRNSESLEIVFRNGLFHNVTFQSSNSKFKIELSNSLVQDSTFSNAMNVVELTLTSQVHFKNSVFENMKLKIVTNGHGNDLSGLSFLNTVIFTNTVFGPSITWPTLNNLNFEDCTFENIHLNTVGCGFNNAQFDMNKTNVLNILGSDSISIVGGFKLTTSEYMFNCNENTPELILTNAVIEAIELPCNLSKITLNGNNQFYNTEDDTTMFYEQIKKGNFEHTYLLEEGFGIVKVQTTQSSYDGSILKRHFDNINIAIKNMKLHIEELGQEINTNLNAMSAYFSDPYVYYVHSERLYRFDHEKTCTLSVEPPGFTDYFNDQRNGFTLNYTAKVTWIKTHVDPCSETWEQQVTQYNTVYRDDVLGKFIKRVYEYESNSDATSQQTTEQVNTLIRLCGIDSMESIALQGIKFDIYQQFNLLIDNTEWAVSSTDMLNIYSGINRIFNNTIFNYSVFDMEKNNFETFADTRSKLSKFSKKDGNLNYETEEILNLVSDSTEQNLVSDSKIVDFVIDINHYVIISVYLQTTDITKVYIREEQGTEFIGVGDDNYRIEFTGNVRVSRIYNANSDAIWMVVTTDNFITYALESTIINACSSDTSNGDWCLVTFENGYCSSTMTKNCLMTSTGDIIKAKLSIPYQTLYDDFSNSVETYRFNGISENANNIFQIFDNSLDSSVLYMFPYTYTSPGQINQCQHVENYIRHMTNMRDMANMEQNVANDLALAIITMDIEIIQQCDDPILFGGNNYQMFKNNFQMLFNTFQKQTIQIPVGIFTNRENAPTYPWVDPLITVNVVCPTTQETECSVWLGNVKLMEHITIAGQVVNVNLVNFNGLRIDFNGHTLSNVKLGDESQATYIWNSASWSNVDVTEYKTDDSASGHSNITIFSTTGQMSKVGCTTPECHCGLFKKYSKNKYTCQDGVFIGPQASIDGVDCSKLILGEIPTSLKGRCGCKREEETCEVRTCPAPHNLPVSMIGQSPFITTCVDGLIFHPNMDHKNINLEYLNLNGIDATGQDWSTYILGKTFGRLEKCPNSLPPRYHCIRQYIFGPKVNMDQMDLSGLKMDNFDVDDFQGVTGALWGCPDTTPRGIRCIWMKNKWAFIGPKISVWGDLGEINFNSFSLTRRRSLLNEKRRLSLQASDSHINLAGARLYGINCPQQLPGKYYCHINTASNVSYIVGPKMNIAMFDLSGADLSSVDLRDISGPLNSAQHCPSKLPLGWVCIGASPEERHLLYGPQSYFKLINLDYFEPTDDKTSINYFDLSGSRFGSIIGTFKNNKCPGPNLLPTNFTCLNGNMYGFDAELSGIQAAGNHNFEGMKLSTGSPNSANERKYTLVKTKEMKIKTYVEICPSQLEDTGNPDPIDNSQIGVGGRRLQNHIRKQKHANSFHTSLKTPLNTELYYTKI